MDSIKQYKILPVFSSPVYITKIENDLDFYFENLRNEEFLPINKIESKNCFISKDVKVLEKHIQLKSLLQENFDFFKNNILMQQNTDFVITTSWVTKFETESHSHYHDHKNSYYSGVLYFDGDAQSAPIQLKTPIFESFLINEPTEYNLFNSKIWQIYPDKNLLIFFPSNLSHRVGASISKNLRYSLAFNLFPVGIIGGVDSQLDIALK